jgi:uncharacterized protein (TIGR03067 family)
MKPFTAAVVGLFLLLGADVRAEDEGGARETEARKALLRLQGTWQLESLTGGKKGAPKGLKKRTLFVGGEVFLVRDGDKLLQAGTLRLSPGKAPKAIDAVVRKGQHEGNTMLGVYELKGDTLRLCFDPEGDGRPKGFTARAGSDLFVAVYKRVRASDETVPIVGRFKCESSTADGGKQVTRAEIQKHGDAYLVRWTLKGGVAYIGVGVRKGDTLSVAWANRGTVGVSVYEVHKGPKLVGTYTELGGVGLIAREQLTPEERGRLEVRNVTPGK